MERHPRLQARVKAPQAIDGVAGDGADLGTVKRRAFRVDQSGDELLRADQCVARVGTAKRGPLSKQRKRICEIGSRARLPHAGNQLKEVHSKAKAKEGTRTGLRGGAQTGGLSAGGRPCLLG